MLQNTFVLCAVIGFIAWYYFNKFQDSEKEYCKLHRKYEEAISENTRIKSRVKDLQSYKNDVSKTFHILDNELVMINDHLKRRTGETSTGNNNSNQNGSNSGRVSILTPELLGTLFNNMNQEQTDHSGEEQSERTTGPEQSVNIDNEQETQPLLASLTYEIQLNGTPYERFLLDSGNQGTQEPIAQEQLQSQ